MNKSERFRALLQRGYFPEELPPPFHTRDLAKFRTIIAKSWTSLPTYKRSVPELFSFPRVGRARRNLALVNPVAQFHTAKAVADNWVAISKRLNTASLHVVSTNIEQGSRAIPPPDFSLIATRRREIGASYYYELVSDFSRFYGTLYTHVIPWALHGKDWCKSNLYSPAYQGSLGAALDKCIRKGQDDQTLGIPVGPDTSRILSELVAAAIDEQLASLCSIKPNQALRFVDDYHVGTDTLGDAERVLACLTKAARKYEVELNSDKTVIQHAKARLSPLWPMELQQHQFETGAASQGRSLEHYFDKAFSLAAAAPSENVLAYALKRIRGLKIFPDNWRLFETYILQAARTNPTVLSIVVQLLVNYKYEGFALRLELASKLAEDTIAAGALNGHHAEVAWALFLCKGLRIKLTQAGANHVSQMESSVCALVALDLEQRKLIDGVLDRSLWLKSMNENGLYSSMWLLAYEADLKGWIKMGTAYVEADAHFKELKAHQVSFYDVKTNVPYIHKKKPKVAPPPLTLPPAIIEPDWDEFIDAGYF